jgi:hypothetical protein
MLDEYGNPNKDSQPEKVYTLKESLILWGVIIFVVAMMIGTCKCTG